jgi:hypothetical protein
LQPGIKALFFSMSLHYSRLMVPEWGRGRGVRKTEQTFFPLSPWRSQCWPEGGNSCDYFGSKKDIINVTDLLFQILRK